MPKLKTNRAAAKRFKVTKTGKVKHAKAYRRHMAASKNRKRKRHLRSHGVLKPTDARTMLALLPYA